MSIRVRKDGTMLCAAKSEKKDGDGYIDDKLHYQLCTLGLIKVIGQDENDAEIWVFFGKSQIDKFENCVTYEINELNGKQIIPDNCNEKHFVHLVEFKDLVSTSDFVNALAQFFEDKGFRAIGFKNDKYFEDK